MNILKHTIKKFIYGTLPYYFMKGYKPGSPYLKYYEYIKEHGYSRHLYEFKDEYANMPVDVQKDEEKGLYYVQKEKINKLIGTGYSERAGRNGLIIHSESVLLYQFVFKSFKNHTNRQING